MSKFKKFCDNLTLRDFVRLPFRLYTAMGVKLFEWDDDDRMTTKGFILMVVIILNLFLNFICKCCYMVFGKIENTAQLTQWSLYLSFAINGTFKMLCVAFGRKKLHNVLMDLERIFPRTAKDYREFRVAEGYNYMMRHCRIMTINHWTIALMFLFFPMVQSSVEYFRSEDEHFVFVARTPYLMVYPFDSTSGAGFIYAYCSQLLGGLTVSCYFVGSDMLLLCTIYVINLQFAYLCLRIRNFKSIDFDNDMDELKDILKMHHTLNDLAYKVNDVFSLSILLNYMISIMVIVFIGIQIITGSDFLDFVKFAGFLTSATMQVYYVCMFGTQLLEYSGSVSESFIGQEWYMADVRYQRMLTLAIARSQRPAHLTAFKFFNISMESFSNLMTTAYQFFTLIKTQMEQQEL